MRQRLALAFPLLLAASVAAQTPTEAAKVAKDKPQETAAALPKDEKTGTTHEAQGQLGTLLNAGNVLGASGKLGAFYAFRAGDHGVRVDLGLGLAALTADADLDPSNGFTHINPDGTTREAGPLDNINTMANARVRYDWFLGDIGSVYASGFAFHDSAANLLMRLRADAGYRHYFFNVDKHALSGELGAVYTIDNAPFDSIDSNRDGKVSVWGDETRFEDSGGVFGARLALAYSNALLDNVTFTQMVEVVPNIFPDVEAPFEAGNPTSIPPVPARIDPNGDNKLGFGEATIAASTTQLTVNLMTNLAVSVNLTLGYDNGAIARRNAYANYDVATSIQLAYKFF